MNKKESIVRPIRNYKKVVSDLFYLNPEYRLRFSVSFFGKDKDGNSKYFMNEFSYGNNNLSTNIYMNLKYHLSIESMYRDENTGERETFVIDNYNMYQFMIAIENACRWFTDKSNQNAFAKMSDGTVRIIGEIDPIVVLGQYNTSLKLFPAVFNDLDKNDIGVMFDINDNTSNIFITASTLMNLKYFLNHFNMYSAAMDAVNYVGRPTVDDYLNINSQNMAKPKEGFLKLTGAVKRKDDEKLE